MENPNLNMDDLGVPPFQETLHVETAWGPGKAKPAAKDQLQILVRKLTGKSNMAGKSFFKTCEEWWFQLISCVLPTNNCDFMVISWLLDGKSPD